MKRKISLLNKLLKNGSLVCALLVSGCASIPQSPPPSFQFSQVDPQTSLVAFSLKCTGVETTATIRFDSTKNNQSFLIPIPCHSSEDFLSRLEIFVLPAASYKIGQMSYSLANAQYWSKGGNFYFTLEPRKVNYLGRIQYLIYQGQVGTRVYSESFADIPQIKLALPNVSDDDYVSLTWQRNWFGGGMAS